jgi:hypothetical protein
MIREEFVKEPVDIEDPDGKKKNVKLLPKKTSIIGSDEPT